MATKNEKLAIAKNVLSKSGFTCFEAGSFADMITLNLKGQGIAANGQVIIMTDDEFAEIMDANNDRK